MELSEGLLILQNFVKKKPIIIVGTGLSLSMGLPGMQALLEYLIKNIQEDSVMEEWNECLELIKSYGFEDGLGKKRVSEGLLSIIIKYTAELLDIEDEKFSSEIPLMQINDYPFAKLLNHLVNSLPPSNPTLTVITPNYDHLVEYACDLIGVNCNTGFYGDHFKKFNSDQFKEGLYKMVQFVERGKQKREPRKIESVKLLKPHGSLKWQRTEGQTFHSHYLIKDATRVIITPGETKYKSSLTDTVMNFHREMANESIRNSESIMIIGYGFNDIHLQTELQKCLKTGTDCLIISKSLSENARKIVKENRQIIALEEFQDKNTRWHFDGKEGVWDKPIWSLDYFVNVVL